MLKQTMIALAGAMLCLGFAESQKAQPAFAFSETQIQPWTETGQDFEFEFDFLPTADAVNGSLNVFGGSIDIDTPEESFELFVDGNSIGTYGCNDATGNILLEGCNITDTGEASWSGIFRRSFSEIIDDFGVSIADLINDDGALTVGVNLNGFVGAFRSEEDAVGVTLEYASVPEPATMLGLMAVGAIATAAAVKRKVSA